MKTPAVVALTIAAVLATSHAPAMAGSLSTDCQKVTMKNFFRCQVLIGS